MLFKCGEAEFECGVLMPTRKTDFGARRSYLRQGTFFNSHTPIVLVLVGLFLSPLGGSNSSRAVAFGGRFVSCW